MFGKSEKPITPRNGHTLMVGIVCRISGCANQKEMSLDDQEDHGKQLVQELYKGPAKYDLVKTTGKGERNDRPELKRIETMLKSEQYDLFVMEDLGRLVRGTVANELIGIAVDNGVRVISPNDCVDTAEASWEEDVISACRDHVGHNAHTSKRIKHKCMNRFIKFGGCTRCEIYGYIKPPGCETYDQWQLNPDAKQIYQQWFAKLKEYPNCTALADWLNGQQIKPGNFSRRSTWDGKMVRRITSNSLLKGMPSRGRLHTVKHYQSGRRICVKNPNGPQYYSCSHLQAIDAALFDEVNEILSKRNQKLGRKVSCNADRRSQFPQKRSRFPSGIATCWYCGRNCVWGANGVRQSLMCAGAREWLCWCSFGFSGGYAQSKIAEALENELFCSPKLRPAIYSTPFGCHDARFRSQPGLPSRTRRSYKIFGA